MSRRECYIVAPIFSIFLLHGILYYLFPEQHYTSENSGGWIASIKYICLALSLPLLIQSRFSKSRANWFWLGVVVLFLAVLLQVNSPEVRNVLLLQFAAAGLAYFYSPFFVRFFFENQRRVRWSFAVILITAICVLFELFIDSGIAYFSRSGWRAVGPFVNPNNTGIVVVLASAIYHFYSVGKLRNIFVAACVIFVLLAGGSKTAMFLYSVVLLFLMPARSAILTLSAVALVGIFYFEEIGSFFTTSDFRSFSMESGQIRASDLAKYFYELRSASLSEVLFGFQVTSVIDNAYLDILSFGGIYLLMIFISAQIFSVWLCWKRNLKLGLILHSLLFAAMFTTNVPRLWPTGYIFWAIVGLSILKPDVSIE